MRQLDFFRRLTSLDWKMLAVAIWWEFQSELYRKEFDLVIDAMADIADCPIDQVEIHYAEGKEILDKIQLAIPGNPRVASLVWQFKKHRLRRLT